MRHRNLFHWNIRVSSRRRSPRRCPVVLLFIFCSVLIGINGQGAVRESIAVLLADANALYQKSDFAGAERGYRQLMERGFEGGVLYYNLGNACFKQQKLGEAIYFWQRARQKLPGDPDIRENLELANLLVVDRVELPADPLPLRWLDSAVRRLTVAQESWLVLLMFMAANGLLALHMLAKSAHLASRALISSLITGSLALLFTCSLAWKVYEKANRQEGVVIEQKADVRSGPGTENITVFAVHEGILLRIRGESGGWYQVSLPNGWSGWLQKNSVRVL